MVKATVELRCCIILVQMLMEAPKQGNKVGKFRLQTLYAINSSSLPVLSLVLVKDHRHMLLLTASAMPSSGLSIDHDYRPMRKRDVCRRSMCDILQDASCSQALPAA